VSETASQQPAFGADEDAPIDRETWSLSHTLRGHDTDVYDLVWLPDSKHLLSGSNDKTARLWNVPKAKLVQQFSEHSNFVQGVAADPRGKYLVTQSCDRSCRLRRLKKIRNNKGKKSSNNNSNSETSDSGVASDSNNANKPVQNIPLSYKTISVVKYREFATSTPAVTDSAATTTTEEPDASSTTTSGASSSAAKHQIFHGETISTFYRRLSWSPDGSVLAIPSGIFLPSAGATGINSTYLFSRAAPSKPVVYLPCGEKPSVATRFNPNCYSPSTLPAPSEGDSNNRLFDLPYRMIFAVATSDTVFIYDTSRKTPLAMVSGLHYAPIVDLSWSLDGTTLAVASMDGYCSFLTFAPDAFGKILPHSELPSTVRDELEAATLLGCQPSHHKENSAVQANSATPNGTPKKKTKKSNSKNTSVALSPVALSPVATLNSKRPNCLSMSPANSPTKSLDSSEGISASLTASSPSSTDENAPKRRRVAPILISQFFSSASSSSSSSGASPSSSLLGGSPITSTNSPASSSN